MNGVTILSIGEYIETPSGAWSIASILLMIFAIFTVFLGAMLFFSSKNFSSLFMGMLILFIGRVMFTTALQGYKSNGPTIKIPQYKVTISDSVPYNEFTEKYNVLETEGKIYTVIDKVEYETAKAKIEGS